jgi:hypothetical protein
MNDCTPASRVKMLTITLFSEYFVLCRTMPRVLICIGFSMKMGVGLPFPTDKRKACRLERQPGQRIMKMIKITL